MDKAPGAERAEETEATLVDASIRGGVEEFGALYDRYVDRVYRYVYYRTGNRSDAEDVTQQVFLNAWKAIGRYQRTGATFIAWLFTIVHNEVVSHYRRMKEESYLDVEVEAKQRWADPEAETMTRHDSVVVREAILQLKPEQQQVIIMRFIEDLEYSDIAAALGKSEGNVRVIQHRALGELHQLLDREVGA